MKKLFTLLTLFLSISFGAWADVETVSIGDGEATQEFVPTWPYMKYSMSEQIYTANEIGMAGNITSIAFYCTYRQDYNARSIDIYMVHTDKTSFSSNTDWVAVTDNDKVYSGGMLFTLNSWQTITLDTPFDYNGTSNLAILIYDHSNYASGRDKFLVFSAEGQAIFRGNDNATFYPTSPTGGTVLNVKNQIKLTIEPKIFAYTVSGGEVTITGFASGFDVPENYDLVIPDEIEGKPVTKIGSDPYNFDGAFGGNSKLKSIVIGSNVQTIDNKSFQYCTNVTDITLSESLITIGEQAFTGCAKLKDLNIPDEVTSIGSQAFAYCGTLDRVCIGRNVSVIGNHAFAQCSKLTDVVISNESQLANIGTYAFSDCSLLTSITIPDGVSTIDSGAFYGCI